MPATASSLNYSASFLVVLPLRRTSTLIKTWKFPSSYLRPFQTHFYILPPVIPFLSNKMKAILELTKFLKNQKMIMSSLNSLTGLVKQLIQQQHTSIPASSNEVVQVVSNVGASSSVSEDDISPSADCEVSATEVPSSQLSPSSDIVGKDELAAIKLKSSGPTAFAGAFV